MDPGIKEYGRKNNDGGDFSGRGTEMKRVLVALINIHVHVIIWLNKTNF